MQIRLFTGIVKNRRIFAEKKLFFNKNEKTSQLFLKLTITIFCGLEKSICYPIDFHKILQECSKIYTLTVGLPIGYFIVLGPRTKYLVIEVQADFQKSVHWAILQVSPFFLFQTPVLSLNLHKSYFFK